MTLSSEQKQQMREQGFVQIENAVPQELVERAQQTINWKMGQGIPADKLTTWSSQSFFPELQGTPAITDLMNASGLIATLESVLGGNTVAAARGGQIALRFPRAPGTPPQAPHPHIDGIYSPHNGVPKGTVGSFTALIGVLLSDLTRDNAGIFVYGRVLTKSSMHIFENMGRMNCSRVKCLKLIWARHIKFRARLATRCCVIINWHTAQCQMSGRCRATRFSFASHIQIITMTARRACKNYGRIGRAFRKIKR